MTALSGTSPGAGDPDDEGHHVERAGHGPPVDPHVGAVADVTETLFSELSIKQMQNVSKFGIKLKSKTSFSVLSNQTYGCIFSSTYSSCYFLSEECVLGGGASLITVFSLSSTSTISCCYTN